MSNILPLLLVAFATSTTLAGSEPILSNALREKLVESGPRDVFITLKNSTSNVLSFASPFTFGTRGARLNALHSSLQSHAEISQQPILNFLSSSRTRSQTFQVESFWITNQIFLKNADYQVISSLIATFPDLIASIEENKYFELFKPALLAEDITLNQGPGRQWGIRKIQATEAWEHIKSKVGREPGEGVLVGSIDTGVRWTHEALKDNFVGKYGWFDPSDKTTIPFDPVGHGSHVMGTIVGKGGIGVAPHAKWAACRGCADRYCTSRDLIACGQFFTCPTLPDGSEPDCSRAPHIVSNSWGGGTDNWYDGVIAAWKAAGIIPIFAIGNSGPSCGSVEAPGLSPNVIGVGSTTNDDSISGFSSLGPTEDGKLKPDMVAPGSRVLSAFHTSDRAYATLSGTSMACPHVAGTVALLKTQDNSLTYDQIKELLTNNADRNLNLSGKFCGGIPDNQFPNNVFGHGRINALRSVRAVS